MWHIRGFLLLFLFPPIWGQCPQCSPCFRPRPMCPMPMPCPAPYCPPPPICPPPPPPPPCPPPPPVPICPPRIRPYMPQLPCGAGRPCGGIPPPMGGGCGAPSGGCGGGGFPPMAPFPQFPAPSGGGCGGGGPLVPPVPSGGGCGGGGGPRGPSSNDCCCGCRSPCRYRRRKAAVHGAKLKVNPACTSKELRDIILENITNDTSQSKRRIQKVAEKEIGGMVNVVCGRGEFSYIAHTDTFCQESNGDVTCYAFRSI